MPVIPTMKIKLYKIPNTIINYAWKRVTFIFAASRPFVLKYA